MENAHILKAGLTNVFHERLCQPSVGSVTCATVAGRPPKQHLNQHTALVSCRDLGSSGNLVELLAVSGLQGRWIWTRPHFHGLFPSDTGTLLTLTLTYTGTKYRRRYSAQYVK